MKSNKSLFALTFVAALCVGSAAGASTDLDSAKALYASASYEEALAVLTALPGTENNEQIHEYRALCLLALGRMDEAELALERIVTDNPFFVVSGEDVSPRLVDLFHEARRRALPPVVQARYGKAKEAYNAGRFDVAAKQFRELAALASTGNLAQEIPTFGDMNLLAEGFLKLAEAEVAAAAPLPRAQVETAPAGRPGALAHVSRIYSIVDTDVIPPIDVEARQLPIWRAPRDAEQRGALRAVLQLVIDQSGGVESAMLDHAISPSDDETLLAAARRWRFQPAMKNGEPVRYLKAIEIVWPHNE